MKSICRIFTVISILACLPFFFSRVSAQQMPTKYATLELFTNTPCPICGSQNPGLFDRLENYEGQYHLVSFYPGTPYSSCIFYQANISENIARRNFYPQIFGTPTVIVNGQDSYNSSGVSTSVLNGLTGGETWLQVRVEETSGAPRDVAVILEDFGGNSATSGRLFAVVVEKEIMYNAPNGETMHHNVFRKFLSAPEGDQVFFSGGIAANYYQYEVEADWQPGQTYVIAWMTSNDSKEIINSGTRFDEVLSSTDDPSDNAGRISLFPNPAASFVNVTIPESLQGGTLKVFDLTGKVVHESQPAQGQEVSRLDASDWKAGAYIVEIKKDGRSDAKVFQVVK